VEPPHPILITRPEEPGRRLAAALNDSGLTALWLPAFDLKPAPKPFVVKNTLARLSTYDLAVFVSPATVHATAAVLPGPWPATTVIGAVGRATVRTLRAELPLGPDVRIVAPETTEDSGSEAFLAALDAAGMQPRRVLLLRAVLGRDWMRERLGERGAQVDALAIYDRQAHAPTDLEMEQLKALAGPIDSVFSSSEAIATVKAMLADVSDCWARLQRGRALASHPRIAQRLADEGFGDIRLVELNGEAIRAELRRQ
jgi:uroporphyrinogen-III synthase